MKNPRFLRPLALSLCIAFLFLAAFYFSALPSLAQIPSAQSDAAILTGQVISDVDGSPVSGVQIQFIDPYFPGLFDVALTDSSGRYTVPASFLEQHNLITATFKIYFKSGGTHLSEYYDNTYDFEEASLITLTTNAATNGIDASLALGGQISGKILSADTNQPLTRSVLALYTPAGEPVPDHSFIVADNNGNYNVTGIVSGTYKLGVQPLDTNSYYVGAYYPDTQWITEAQSIQVDTGIHMSNVNFALSLGGYITGTVTSSNSRAWVEPHIEVYDLEGRLVPARVILSQLDSRNYTISNLLPGSYRLFIADKEDAHRPEYYDNLTTLDAASTVSVLPGQVTGGINAELTLIPRAASIATSSALSDAMMLTLDYNPVPIYTIDGGRSWYQVPTAPWVTENSIAPPNIGLAPRTEPGSPIRMLVTAAYDALPGLYRSGDQGQSWAQETFPFENCTGFVFVESSAPVVSPAAPSWLYMTSTCIIHVPFGGSIYHSSLLRSRDGGVSWQESPTLDASSASHTLQVIPSPVIGERVYAQGSYPQYDNAHWLQSDDGGDTWSAKEFPVSDLVLDAQDSARLYGISLYYSSTEPDYGKRSENGGEQWVNWAQQPCNLGHPDTGHNVLQLVAHPTQTQVLFLRCDQGLYRSDNGGDSWTELASTPGHLLAPDYGTPGRILWGKDDGLWASTDNGATWQHLMPNYALSTAADAQTPLFLPSVSTTE